MLLRMNVITTIALIFAQSVLTNGNVAKKRILVFGGMMKSHHISMVPAIEELAGRGHEVVYALPNTDEGHQFFPKGIDGVELVFLGKNDWSFEKLTIPDLKNLEWYEQVLAWAKLVWNYRDMIEKPMFSMFDETIKYIESKKPDLIFSHLGSFAINHKLSLMANAPPRVMLFSAQPQPEFMIDDTDMLCRYPNMMKPNTLEELKSSLALRVKNRAICQFIHYYTKFAMREIDAILVSKGMKPMTNLVQHFREQPVVVAYGGPPMLTPLPLPDTVHLVGVVEKAFPQTLEQSILEWLDAAAADAVPVLYVSMGTKYELSNRTCKEVVDALESLTSGFGLRVLWSLRKSQQEVLSALLPQQGKKIRIEAFTQQPEVLAHRAVKVFLSHCGWGGVTDSLTAGVPTLAYPGFSEQFNNAIRLVDVGAGLLIKTDFSNLVRDTQRLLNEPAFAAAAKLAGEKLRTRGGLSRLVEIIETAAVGQHLEAPVEQKIEMSKIDPFYLQPQELEKALSMALGSVVLVLMLLLIFCCCRCCCKCCSHCCGGERQKCKEKSA